MSGKRHGIIIIGLLLVMVCGCHKDAPKKGHLAIDFTLSVGEDVLQYDTLCYHNAAGNLYEVNEVKFFISELQLHHHDGSTITVQDQRSTHYYDSHLATTHRWTISDELPLGRYDSITFVFGLPAEKNITGFFVNPPENNMAWPDYLGGGYHYLQINGYWKRNGTTRVPFNLHTGIGQLYEGGMITQYIPNHFTVSLSEKSFTIEEESTTIIPLHMDINQWFVQPHIFDLDEWGGGIMQNQAAQEILRENGQDVFR